MAVAASLWARQQRAGSAARKAVLLVLADRAKDQTWEVWAGQEALAAEADVSERTVRAVLAEFERWGVIERTKRRRPDGYRTSDVIRLKVGAAISPEVTAGSCDQGKRAISPEVSSPEVSSPETIAGSSDLGQQISPEPAAGTSPANERRSHRNQLPRNNGKLETPTTSSGLTTHDRSRRPSPPSRSPASLTSLAAFTEFVEVYPHSVKLKAAQAAWNHHTRGVDLAEVIKGAKAYAEYVVRTGEREQFMEEPAAWLGRSGWTDRLDPPRPPDWLDNMPNRGSLAGPPEALGLNWSDMVDPDGPARVNGYGPMKATSGTP